ncbi:MAG: hypothetical protein KGR26_13905, partial [Cyanobacteria bacterium REEB65]|nr:hypothetical protein [Cyanobacteria bacterium REEB65]
SVKIKDLTDDIGYIRLTSFMNENADQEVHDALVKLQDKKALVLDLRGNPGGLLPNAVNIGLFFIDHGPIVQIVDRDGNKELLPPDEPGSHPKLVWPKNKPVVVLVDGGSASASEILSGALQDTHVGILIGTRTFGKGLVQTVHALDGGSGVAITTNKYLTAGGNDINKRGIVPNITVEPMRLAALPVASQEETDVPLADRPGFKDLQLDMALRYLKGRLGEGPIVRIPAQPTEPAEPSSNPASLALPKVLDFDTTLSFKRGTRDLSGLKATDPLDSTLGDLGDKLHGLTADQLDEIVQKRDFGIEIDSTASKADGMTVAADRAEHISDYIRGFFLDLGEPLDAGQIQIKTALDDGTGGQTQLKVHLPYGEVLNGSAQ